MSRKPQQFLVRGPDGRMATIVATSMRAALDQYIATHRTRKGDSVSVKPRGEGDWTDYRVSL